MKTILVDTKHCFIIEKEGKFEIFQELHQLLEEYPNKKILLSNSDDSQKEKFGLTNIPYEFFSLKHNPEKSNPEYYRIFLDSYNLKNNDVICFEHSPKAIKSAQSIGINTYFYDKEKKDLKSLKDFLDENLK